MFDKSDILARLQDGETIDAIAAELTAVLNEAEAQYQEETIKANDEKLRLENAKREAAEFIRGGLMDYLLAVEEQELFYEVRNLEADKIVEMLDSAISMTKSLEKLKTLEFKSPFDLFFS